MRILLVEDDLMMGERLRARLRQDNYEIDWVQDRRAAELAIGTNTHAVVLLDLGLPRDDGISVLAYLRQRVERVPVLAIAARKAAPDPVISLDLGADDCVVWPFNLDELAARVRALLRRYAVAAPSAAMSDRRALQ